MKIYVDVDNTIVDIVTPFLKAFAGGKWRIEDVTEYNIDNCLGPGAISAIFAFVDDHPDEIFPYPGAVEILDKIATMGNCEVVIFSNRTDKARADFARMYGYAVLPKSEVLLDHGKIGDGTNIVVIDDYPPEEFLNTRARIFLVDQPWNRGQKFRDIEKDKSRVRRVASLVEAVQLIFDGKK